MEPNVIKEEGIAQSIRERLSYSLEIGTVTTVAPGTPASAEITGTGATQQLNLAIPRGAKGEDGADGEGGGGSNSPKKLVRWDIAFLDVTAQVTMTSRRVHYNQKLASYITNPTTTTAGLHLNGSTNILNLSNIRAVYFPAERSQGNVRSITESVSPQFIRYSNILTEVYTLSPGQFGYSFQPVGSHFGLFGLTNQAVYEYTDAGPVEVLQLAGWAGQERTYSWLGNTEGVNYVQRYVTIESSWADTPLDPLPGSEYVSHIFDTKLRQIVHTMKAGDLLALITAKLPEYSDIWPSGVEPYVSPIKLLEESLDYVWTRIHPNFVAVYSMSDPAATISIVPFTESANYFQPTVGGWTIHQLTGHRRQYHYTFA